MTYSPDIHHRRSIRLKGFDYSSANAYFVTVCVEDREFLFGNILDGEMHVSDAGHLVSEWWIKLPDKFPGIALDEFAIMPNHFHGIIVLGGEGADPRVCPDYPDPCVCQPSTDPRVCPALRLPSFPAPDAAHLTQTRAHTRVRPYGKFMTNKSDTPEPIMLSALEHYSYCPRQCALIHLEQVWDENIYTMRGRETHENVDVESSHELSGIRFERALPIWSKRLNIVGKADMVEFHGNVPYPVEYKSGRHRKGRHETLQLCAQALCLEEMFDVQVPKGALYWHGSRERREVVFTDTMRELVAEIAAAVRDMVAERLTPPPVNDKRCKNCSLKESCLPKVVGEKRRCRKAAVELYAIEGGK